MECMQSTESLKSEVEELRSAVTTVTEALILFQEFVENEIGEMSYFRDSGSYYKLVETLNKLRVKTFKVPASHNCKQSSVLRQIRSSIEMTPRETYDIDDDEQVEVDVDYNDDDPVDEITIRQVFSVPSPEKVSAETLSKKTNAAITITPVFSPMDEKKKELHHLLPPVPPQPALVTVDKGTPASFFPSNSSFMIIDNQLTIKNQEVKENERMLNTSTGNKNIGPPNTLPSTISIPVFPPVITVPIMKSKKSLKKKDMKKALQKSNPNGQLKKKAKVENVSNGPIAPYNISLGMSGSLENGIDAPLNLKKKLKRPSACPVKCNLCGKCYSSKGVMSRHIKEAHKLEPQFPCFYCPTKFRNGPARLEHMNSSHREDMNSVICPYCQRKSSSVAGKRNHMMLCARKHRSVVGNLPPATSSTTNLITTSSTDSGVQMDAHC